MRALNLPGCPTAHFLTDLSEALAVPSLGGTWWVLRVPGACWEGFHGRGSGQPHIASQAPTVCGDKQGWPRWRGGGGAIRNGGSATRGRRSQTPRASTTLNPAPRLPNEHQALHRAGEGALPRPSLPGAFLPLRNPGPGPAWGWSGQAEGAGGRPALTGGPEAAQAPARPLRRTSRPLFTTLC